jgi:hypothetical protein
MIHAPGSVVLAKITASTFIVKDMHGCWKSMQEFVGERRHRVEFHISLEAIELSKKSRVAEAL